MYNTFLMSTYKAPFKVGFDFDGVITSNYLRAARIPVYIAKRLMGKGNKLEFFVPHSRFSRLAWSILYYAPLPNNGLGLLKSLVSEGVLEAHLISGRFSFAQKEVLNWLESRGHRDIFKSVSLNAKDEQPHTFKERVLKEKNIGIYVEDNLDIVNYLKVTTSIDVYWVSNLVDRLIEGKSGYPHLQSALKEISLKYKK